MNLPYLPTGYKIHYVPADNKFIIAAQKIAKKLSFDPKHPTGTVIVRNGKIIGRGANGSNYHEKYGCKRKELGISTGEKYDLCPGCSPIHHAEQKAIQNVQKKGEKTDGADLYLWGHWWCCKSCWNCMIDAKIRDIYLIENAYEQFGR